MSQPNEKQSVNLKNQLKPTGYQQGSIKTIWQYPFGSNSFILLGVGVLVIALGFFLMASGISNDPSDHTTWNNPMAVDVAPIVLVIGYCVIVPFAIMKRQNSNSDSQNDAQ